MEGLNKDGGKISRRKLLVGAGVAAAAIGGGVLAYKAHKRAKVARLTKSFKTAKVRDAKKLAELSFEHGLNRKESLLVDKITKALLEMDSSMTYKRIIATIGNNPNVRAIKIKVTSEKVARIKEVIRLLEIEPDQKLANGLRIKLYNQSRPN